MVAAAAVVFSHFSNEINSLVNYDAQIGHGCSRNTNGCDKDTDFAQKSKASNSMRCNTMPILKYLSIIWFATQISILTRSTLFTMWNSHQYPTRANDFME